MLKFSGSCGRFPTMPDKRQDTSGLRFRCRPASSVGLLLGSAVVCLLLYPGSHPPTNASDAPSDSAVIVNHATWRDSSGRMIEAHDGGITRVGNEFYLTSLLYIKESDRVLAMFDQSWITDDGHHVKAPKPGSTDLNQSRYLWLPVDFQALSGTATVGFRKQWKPFSPE